MSARLKKSVSNPLDRRRRMWQPELMKRLFLFGFSVLSLVLSLAYPRPAFAQQKIAVRSGGHETFSRVVFDWGRAVEYEIDESKKDLLIIRFKEPGKPDLAGFDPSKLDNVTGFRVLKNDPLIVSMIVPEKSKVKAFNLQGTRFVVDIYNPEPAKKEDPPAEEKSAKQTPVTPEAKSEAAPIPEKKPEVAKPEPEPETIAAVKAEEKPQEPKKEDPPKEKQEAPKAEAKAEQKPEPVADAAKAELPHSEPPAQSQTAANGLNFSLVPETQAKAKPPLLDNQPAEPVKAEPEQKPEKPAPTPEAPEKHPAPEPAPPSEAEKTHPPKDHAEETRRPPDTKKNAGITPVPILESKTPKPAPLPVPEPVKIKVDPASIHVLTVTSTSSVGLAVFEQENELWFVSDQESRHLIPVINSKTPHIFASFTGQTITGGQAYKTTLPQGYEVRGKGGELSWKIILDKQEKSDKPIDIQRISRGGSFSRGAKIVWPVTDATAILDMTDPQTGQRIKVVTVKQAEQFAGGERDFVDFSIMHSIVGLAIFPKVDDLEVQLTAAGVEISRPGGLAILSDKDMDNTALSERAPPGPKGGAQGVSSGPRIFNFAEWQRIPYESLEKNKNLILTSLPQYTKAGRAEDLIALAKAYLLSGMGAEAIGFLDFAAQELPEIAKNPEFIALRGMANAFDGKTDVALAHLQRPELKPYEEVGYWKSYVLADLGDWQQAIEVLPDNLAPFYEYPGQVSRRLALVMVEVLLRAGRTDKADELLALIEYYKSELDEPMSASLAYLRGESARQKGQKQKAIDIWRELEKGPDDLYRVKAGLAVTRLLDEEGAITTDKVIDRLERLRYAWRGDEIEALVNYWLGDAYFRKKDYVKGLGIMRDSAEVAGETELGHRVAADMSKVFTDLFLGPDLAKLSALDAVALYEQFSELSPPGAEGDKLARMLAEHLVKADLLDRAARILENQVNNRLKGDDLIRVGKRLAVIYLLDRQPQKALATLSKLADPLKLVPPGPEKDRTEYEITLLRARAYAQDKRAQQALTLLKDMEPEPEINRLRADISWQSGFWAEAADALGQVMEDQGLGGGTPLTDKQTQVLMNLAVALNLANDRIAIANLREKYGDLMSKTTKAHQFEVITRQRRNAVLADRETLLSVVSEVDLFKEFLDAYKSADAPPAATAPPSGKP